VFDKNRLINASHRDTWCLQLLPIIVWHVVFVFRFIIDAFKIIFMDCGWVHVTRSLVLCVCFVDRCLSSFLSSLCFCPSSIYRFWLPLWYLQTILPIPFLFSIEKSQSIICSKIKLYTHFKSNTAFKYPGGRANWHANSFGKNMKLHYVKAMLDCN
jgi:hypothetical protein